MGDVIHASFAPLPTDGGKAHIRARRIEIGLGHGDRFDFSGLGRRVDELVMDHVDVEMPNSPHG